MNDSARDLIELHQLTTEELRHTATIIWQFAIAIVTLQGGAVGLSAHIGFHTGIGKGIAAVGFFLSCLFSIMLVRQAVERRGFVARICAIEKELQSSLAIFRIEIPRAFSLVTSQVFAWLLLIESAVALIVIVVYGFCCCPSA